jgi:hypothetical protein
LWIEPHLLPADAAGMDETPAEPVDDVRVGVLAIRAWVDGPLPEGLHVRITSRLDVSSSEDVVTMAVDREAVLATVREWLDTFVSN